MQAGRKKERAIENESTKLKERAKSRKRAPKRPRGRPRLGDKPLSNAERQRRYRARKASQAAQ
jgi:hypothetical protein